MAAGFWPGRTFYLGGGFDRHGALGGLADPAHDSSVVLLVLRGEGTHVPGSWIPDSFSILAIR